MDRFSDFMIAAPEPDAVAGDCAGVTLQGGIALQTTGTQLCFEEEDTDAFCDRLKKSDIRCLSTAVVSAPSGSVIRTGVSSGQGEKLDAVILRFTAQGMSAEETAAGTDIPLRYCDSLPEQGVTEAGT